MEAILAIMLYLVLVFSPGTYYQSEIDAIYDANETQITNVQNDANLNPTVQATYGTQVEYINVLSDIED